ncbi:MAG: glutamine-hydrolyzing GMP synthase [Candidatus Jettenia sp.]|uniref:GMP synthase [glutamine-hydrolyzing] n=1 Tax=Candidatus Jettenia caeni TaxID=247490 RepID=I3IMG7_9BACT|nr:glutamine-hydrolyzing GMP synthase [Candidatus Jettenia sp. AMX1]MBC6930429.1 glutamine-hydrolyzing GMP synthase [Candidatus Jettenia sp.]WKZ14670.1 MAG: glutamine-hydrolyzing GMP synthase [Candidatus Jettenia caeni]KAA0247261.1 MAG: glutamine-hydrolyzing GMP synthase [Candidatus Jettenia sp. AMX1]MCE7882040.1 glutamine-hydrolyzing GMP synthase [Candidatus Jettenia sp. AMX1]MCQ3928592.1 glutamine-hydrolyzing GMP synthase [Candidatus Jettenia sp.]
MIEENNEKVLILDFGSQYAQLIARRVRENNVFSEIVSHKITAEQIKKINPKGIIFTGGPASVYVKNAPQCDEEIVDLGIPILGICYGMQLGCQMLKATVKPTVSREYGRTTCIVNDQSKLFKSVDKDIIVWMSHGDQVVELPIEFESLAFTHNCPYAGVKHKKKAFYGVQFHPEVTHTLQGSQIIRNFLYEICGCTGTWKIDSYIEKSLHDIHSQVGDGRVVCGLSGGVDSAVTAALIHKAIGNHISCIFVDNGLLRDYEADEVVKTFKDNFTVDLHVIHARERFLDKLKGVIDPEKKRKIIGHEFIEIFKEEAKRISGVKFLAQGTLYPDVIESIPAHGGPTVTIKSHHNVGGLPAELGFELVEPLRFLFKDEVRKIGEELGLPEELVWRHPFPGPGLAIRIIGEVTKPRLEILRNTDKIVIEEIRKAGLYRSVSQCFAVLLPLSTVGVMGDERSYENVIAIRAVETTDFMTADWYRIPHEVLGTISNRVINEIKGVNRVVYDISTKPPSTIEWE